jgi:hypothetical protein
MTLMVVEDFFHGRDIYGLEKHVPEYEDAVADQNSTDEVLVETRTVKEVDTTQDSLDAGQAIGKLSALRKAIVAHYDAYAKPTFKLHRAITRRRNAAIKSVQEEEHRITSLVLAFDRQVAKDKQQAEKAMSSDGTEVILPNSQPSPSELGMGKRSRWSFEVMDLNQVMQAVQRGLVPATILRIDDKVLGSIIRAQKNAFRCPGIRVREEKSVVVYS